MHTTDLSMLFTQQSATDPERLIGSMSASHADALFWTFAPAGPQPEGLSELEPSLVVYRDGRWQPTILGAEVAHRIVDLTASGAVPWARE